MFKFKIYAHTCIEFLSLYSTLYVNFLYGWLVVVVDVVSVLGCLTIINNFVVCVICSSLQPSLEH